MEANHSRGTIEEYVAFLIEGIALEPVQQAHFSSCEECKHATVEAVCAKLETQTELHYQPTI